MKDRYTLTTVLAILGRRRFKSSDALYCAFHVEPKCVNNQLHQAFQLFFDESKPSLYKFHREKKKRNVSDHSKAELLRFAKLLVVIVNAIYVDMDRTKNKSAKEQIDARNDFKGHSVMCGLNEVTRPRNWKTTK